MSIASSLRNGRRALAAALAGLGVALATQTAHGQTSFSASVTPDTVSSPAQLEYALTMVNSGDTDERYAVAVIAPHYRPARRGDGAAETQSIVALDYPTIDGPASFARHLSTTVAELPVCSIARDVRAHGYGINGLQFGVILPPRSASMLRARYRAGLPFWPDLDLRLRFRLKHLAQSGVVDRTLVVASPQPAITGRVAVHITFRTTPKSARVAFEGSRPIALGRPIRIRGRTNPPIRGEHVELRYARITGPGTADKRPRDLPRGRAARLRVDAHGRFYGRWLPPGEGSYELWARYDSTRASLISDNTCPRLLRVRSR